MYPEQFVSETIRLIYDLVKDVPYPYNFAILLVHCVWSILDLFNVDVVKSMFDNARPAEESDADTAKLISEGKVRVDSELIEGKASLHAVLCRGETKSARKLIKLGAPVNGPTAYRRNTPLHYTAKASNCCYMHDWNDVSCAFGHLTPDRSKEFADLAEFLLCKGADPNLKNYQGSRPLHVAINYPVCGTGVTAGPRMVRLLFEWGAHVDSRNNAGDTPLAAAIRVRSNACIRELLSCGANIHEDAVTRRIGRFLFATAEIKDHWVRLHAAGLRRFGEWSADQVLESRESLHAECSAEVGAMKSTFVDSRISLYDFLHMEPKDRRVCVNGKKLKSLVKSPELRTRFPNCHVLIEGSYHEAVARKSLLKRAAEAWCAMTDRRLPDVCIERILDFLTNGDMLAMIENHENEAALSEADGSDGTWKSRLSFYLHRCAE